MKALRMALLFMALLIMALLIMALLITMALLMSRHAAWFGQTHIHNNGAGGVGHAFYTYSTGSVAGDARGGCVEEGGGGKCGTGGGRVESVAGDARGGFK